MNLRVIKKDIDYILNEVVSDCLIAYQYVSEESKESVMELVNEAVDLRHDLFLKVNHPEATNLKAHYKAVYKELLEKTDALFDKLSSINKK